MFTPNDIRHMRRALSLATRGEGKVEPNPLVGCVIVRNGEVVGEGWHAKFGGPHAEAAALADAGEKAEGADLYVTLEPCCHHGKTPPCSEAVIQAGVKRVIVAAPDPSPHVDGGGFSQLQNAGVIVEVGLLEAEANQLMAPFLMKLRNQRPWVIGKWAMTLDGKIATHTGDSQWISGECSREIVHEIRGRVDAILVGANTARNDDPKLTARPVSKNCSRTPLRVVFDSLATLASDSHLVKTAHEIPVLVAAGSQAETSDVARLEAAGCEVWQCDSTASREQQLRGLLRFLAEEKSATNILVEGGGQLLGALFDSDLIDEVHVFVAPKLCGGAEAISPIAGSGITKMTAARSLHSLNSRQVDGDTYIWGKLR